MRPMSNSASVLPNASFMASRNLTWSNSRRTPIEVFGFFPEELGSRAGVFRRVLPGWLGKRSWVPANSTSRWTWQAWIQESVSEIGT